MKKAGNIARDNLVSFGTCFGKFTKTGKYRLHITALDYLAPYAKVSKYCLHITALDHLAPYAKVSVYCPHISALHYLTPYLKVSSVDGYMFPLQFQFKI